LLGTAWIAEEQISPRSLFHADHPVPASFDGLKTVYLQTHYGHPAKA
jgi:hypothetical protein